MASLVSVQQVEAELKKLGKKHRKKEKAYRHIKTLEAKNKAGEKLEKNQLIKLQSGLKTQLEKELLEFAETRQKLLLAASVTAAVLLAASAAAALLLAAGAVAAPLFAAGAAAAPLLDAGAAGGAHGCEHGCGVGWG